MRGWRVEGRQQSHKALGAVTGLGAWLLPVAAMAQGAADPGGSKGMTLMLVAYIALWVLIFGYVALVARRQQAVRRDLEALERRLDEVLGLDKGK